MAHLVGQRWQDDDGLWVVVAHGTHELKGSHYQCAWYHLVGETIEDIDEDCEWSSQTEVTKWIAECPPTDTRFPNSLDARGVGLRTHPMGFEKPDSAFWVLPELDKFRPAAVNAMKRLEHMRKSEPGALAIMMSGTTTVLADVANEIFKKLRYDLLREPAEDEKDFVNYVTQTKDIVVQHESFAVLRAVMFAAGFFPEVRKRRVTAWKMTCPDALERLLGVSSTKTGVNGLVRMWTYSTGDMIKRARDERKRKRKALDYATRLSDSMAGSDKEIYDNAADELGETGVAGKEDGTVLPAWLLRHKIQDKWIEENDPRVFAHAKVCVDKPKSVFELQVRPRVLPGPAGAHARFNAGFVVRARFSFQGWKRNTMRSALLPQVAALA